MSKLFCDKTALFRDRLFYKLKERGMTHIINKFIEADYDSDAIQFDIDYDCNTKI